MADRCPKTRALSALLDGQTPPRQRRNLLAHIDHCAACGEMLRELETLRDRLHALPPERLGFDLGAVIEARIRAHSRPSGRTRRPALRWLLFPLGGAAALTLGLHLGSTLLRPPAGDVPQGPAMLTMAVFDPIPPGNLCPVPKSCPSGNDFR
ncbi:zf-HC2 domain-containing protein [Aromatoleum buckelii]|uniref:Zf-HC2 domain-containing protein n=1 Tax=Aromatoleum buckelii TaxID=200254 RepID=A0ABX1N2H3_9RHOO|nr:zf-HC2 domain-containing protein [Aromatoleum buckelii]MCK0510879.1 zf-HC2 domain-containing protein [Aromatoleum buckelii]